MVVVIRQEERDNREQVNQGADKVQVWPGTAKNASDGKFHPAVCVELYRNGELLGRAYINMEIAFGLACALVESITMNKASELVWGEEAEREHLRGMVESWLKSDEKDDKDVGFKEH